MRSGQVWLAAVGGAVVLGGAGWLLGPAWGLTGLAVGAVAGPFAALVAVTIVRVYTTPEPLELVQAGQPVEALLQVEELIPAGRELARIWPGQFRETVAQQLVARSQALQAIQRYSEALAAAEEAVAICRTLATSGQDRQARGLARALNHLSYPLRAIGRGDEAWAAADEAVQINRSLARARPRKYRYGLACSLGTRAEMLAAAGEHKQALAAVDEAVEIYQGMRPGHRAAPEAVEVLCLRGQLLCDLSRPGEAAQPLARAWRLAVRQDGRLPTFAGAVLKAAYQADPGGFGGTWRAETGADPPGWTTGDKGVPP